jgi:hypothetical protein
MKGQEGSACFTNATLRRRTPGTGEILSALYWVSFQPDLFQTWFKSEVATSALRAHTGLKSNNQAMQRR